MLLQESRPHLDKIKALAVELNDASGAHAAELRAVEEELSSFNLGLTVDGPEIVEGDEMVSADSDDVVTKECWQIGFAKYGDRWRIVAKLLAVRTEYRGGVDVETRAVMRTVPLADAPRDVRLAGMSRVPALLDNVAHMAWKAGREAKLGRELTFQEYMEWEGWTPPATKAPTRAGRKSSK